VEETLRWITTLQQIALLSLTPDTIDSVGNDLTGTFSKKSMILGRTIDKSTKLQYTVLNHLMMPQNVCS